MGVKKSTVPPDDVAAALERILASSHFQQSNRLSNFLRFAVEKTLRGESQDLKEYLIATEVYGRNSEFNPAEDSIVRSEARRLRRKLKEYYESEGEEDAVVIFFRPGSYVPIHRWRISLGEEAPQPKPSALFSKGDGVRVIVEPFLAHAADDIASTCAFGITEEILHKLIRVPGVRAVSGSVMQSHPPGTEHPAASDTLDLVLIGGSVRSGNGMLRVTARVTTSDGMTLWSQRFDASIDAGAGMRLQEAVAAALLGRISPRTTIARNHGGAPTRTLLSMYPDVLAAESLLEEGAPSAIQEALCQFEGLLVKSPEFARLHTGVAQCCVSLAQLGLGDWPELDARAGAAAGNALELDAKMPDAHLAQACVLALRWKWKQAEASFEEALRLGDLHSAHRQFGQFLTAQSRFDEAWEHLKAAQEMDPFSARQRTSVAQFFYHSRRQSEAIAFYTNLERQGPLTEEIRGVRALTAIQAGDLSTAVAIAGELRSSARRAGAVYLALAAEIFARCGEEVVARLLVQEGGLLEPNASLSDFRKASLALALKDRAQGLELLAISRTRREPDLPWLAADPRFDEIRDEPEYLATIQAVFEQDE